MIKQQSLMKKDKTKNKIVLFAIMGLILLLIPLVIWWVDMGVEFKIRKILTIGLTFLSALLLLFSFINTKIYIRKVGDEVSLTFARAALVPLIFVISPLVLFSSFLNYNFWTNYYEFRHYHNIFVIVQLLTMALLFLSMVTFLINSSKSILQNNATTKSASSILVVGVALIITIVISFDIHFRFGRFYFNDSFTAKNSYIEGKKIMWFFMTTFGALWFALYLISIFQASNKKLKIVAIFNILGLPLYIKARKLGKANDIQTNSLYSSNLDDLKNEKTGYRKYQDEDGNNVEERVERYNTGNGTKVVKTVNKSSSTSNIKDESFSSPSFDFDDDFMKGAIKKFGDFDSSFKNKSKDEYKIKDELKEKIDKLKDLKAEGVLSEEEYKKERSKLIAKYTESL